MTAIRTGGPVGPAGVSAYELAVEDGFVGTEDEWLASLVGPPSAPVTVFQSSPAADWTVAHNLGRHPVAVFVYDTANTQILGSFEYVDDDTIQLHFSSAFAGRTEVL